MRGRDEVGELLCCVAVVFSDGVGSCRVVKIVKKLLVTLHIINSESSSRPLTRTTSITLCSLDHIPWDDWYTPII